jgi:CheY-like chemotaxis protein
MTLKSPETNKSDTLFRILCVEDNPMFQRILTIALGTYGFEVITASNGIDALKQYNANKGQFGAIISDNEMPQMGGLEFISSVRKMGYKGRIVVMSGNLKLENLRAYQDCEISGFFTKPFNTSLLANMLLQGT